MVLVSVPVALAEHEYVILNELDISAAAQFASEIGIDVDMLIRNMLSGDTKGWSFLVEIPTKIVESVFLDFREMAVSLLIPLVVSFMMSALLGKNEAAMYVVRLICRYGCISTLILSFVCLRSVAHDLVGIVLKCSDAMLPILITVTALAGSEQFASALTPLAAVGSDFIQNIIAGWGISLSTAMAGTAIAGNLSEHISLKRLHNLLKQIIQWGIGILMTVYAGMVAIQGRVATGRDTTATRAARFAIENIIPVVGGNVSDSLDSILSAALAVKNAIGLTGLALLISACLIPLGRIAGMSILLKLISAISEPLGEKTLSTLISQFAEAIEMLFVIAVTTLMLCAILFTGCMIVSGARIH